MMRWKIFPSEEIPHTEIFPEDLEELFREWDLESEHRGGGAQGRQAGAMPGEVLQTRSLGQCPGSTCCSVTDSCPTLWPRGLQHARLLCALPSPRVCSGPCPLNQWCYLTVSCSATSSSFCLQALPVPGSLPMSRLCVRRPRCWSILPSSEHSGLIFFRMD